MDYLDFLVNSATDCDDFTLSFNDSFPLDSTNLVHFTSVATLPSKGAVKLVSSVLSIDDAVRKGLGFLFQISKHNQNREIKLQVPHYLLLVSSPASQTAEFCILVTGMYK